MNYLWISKFSWDQPTQNEVTISWKNYHQKLPTLATLRIVFLITWPNTTYELHGFCHSSEAAYAAIILFYLRVKPGNSVTVNF